MASNGGTTELTRRPAAGARCAGPAAAMRTMDRVEQLLRRLALNDEKLVGSVLARTAGDGRALDRKAEALVQVGALLSVGASTASLRWTVELAQATGATDDEILGVLGRSAPRSGSRAWSPRRRGWRWRWATRSRRTPEVTIRLIV